MAAVHYNTALELKSTLSDRRSKDDMSFPIQGAHLAGAFTSFILYGIFARGYAHMVRGWCTQTSRVPRFLLASTTVLFASVTAFTGNSIAWVYTGFVNRDSIAIPIYFGEVSATQETVSTALIISDTALADAILMYRCWLVWKGCRPVRVFTSVLYLGFLVVSCFLLVALKQSKDGNSIFHQTAATWLRVHTIYTLAQNAIIYGLIIFRIWRTLSRSSAYSQSTLTPVIKRLLVVGLIYVLMCAFLLITNLLASTVFVIGAYLWPPFVGIIFLALIAQEWRTDEQDNTGTLSMQTTIESFYVQP